MTSEKPNLHVSKNLNISRTKQDIEKLKTPLRLVWKYCSVVFKIRSKIFSLQWHFNRETLLLSMCLWGFEKLSRPAFDKFDTNFSSAAFINYIEPDYQ